MTRCEEKLRNKRGAEIQQTMNKAKDLQREYKQQQRQEQGEQPLHEGSVSDEEYTLVTKLLMCLRQNELEVYELSERQRQHREVDMTTLFKLLEQQLTPQPRCDTSIKTLQREAAALRAQVSSLRFELSLTHEQAHKARHRSEQLQVEI